MGTSYVSIQEMSEYRKHTETLLNHIKDKAEQTGNNPYVQLYDQLKALKRTELRHLERVLRSFVSGSISEEDKKYFDKITFKDVNGILNN